MFSWSKRGKEFGSNWILAFGNCWSSIQVRHRKQWSVKLGCSSRHFVASVSGIFVLPFWVDEIKSCVLESFDLLTDFIVFENWFSTEKNLLKTCATFPQWPNCDHWFTNNVGNFISNHRINTSITTWYCNFRFRDLKQTIVARVVVDDEENPMIRLYSRNSIFWINSYWTLE